MAPALRSLQPRLLLLFCGLALGGCTTLGPDFREPEVEWLQDWQPTLYDPAADSEPADLEFWWRQFNDPSLNRLIEAARRDSISLTIAGLRILESRAQLGIAGSNLYPQVQQASGSAAYERTQRWGGTLGDDIDTTKLSRHAQTTRQILPIICLLAYV